MRSCSCSTARWQSCQDRKANGLPRSWTPRLRMLSLFSFCSTTRLIPAHRMKKCMVEATQRARRSRSWAKCWSSGNGLRAPASWCSPAMFTTTSATNTMGSHILSAEAVVLVNYVRRFVDEFVNTGVINWIVAHPEVCISFWVCCDNGRQLRRLRQHGGTERRAWNKSGLGKIFELPEALVIQKEEGLVSSYRPPPSVNPY